MKSREFYNNTEQPIQFLFTMVLLFFLAISAIFTVLFGAEVYKNIEERMNENFNSVTALSYISNKVKQNDKAEMVSVEQVDGIPVLKLVEKHDQELYDTLIYCKDGELKELFCDEGSGLALEDGMDIMDVPEMSFEMIGKNLLKVRTYGEHGKYLLLALRSGEGGYE
ncbi:DUF4860 domain-containing protein [Aminipila luticellarii]|uniref:DUF4860 domain-containing protein n=1 Tax=Aminipila luticellarii TaxID=2507160 RepID=A0A410PT98_9FIRM|nr:DUF4860 domain-containing protein [Aminipila luticellarii]QAT42129.1 DUF4860 domain-containing protein [Aminipila luticellarii]